MSALPKILAAAVFAFGGGAAALLYSGEDVAAPPPPTAQVRVAASTLTIGAFLDDDDAPFQTVPKADIEEGWVVDGEDDVLGAVVIAQLPAGRPITRAALLTPGQEGFLAAVLAPGKRAVSVGVDAVSGNAGLIFPGDRVDVVLTQRLDDEAADADPALRWGAETILRNVRVIAVDQNLRSDLAERDSAAVARTVTFEVSPAEAEVIAVARNLGALSLTLRSLIVEGAEEDDAGTTSPTWAGDVSAVLRAVTGRAEPREPGDRDPATTPVAATAPAEQPRRIVVLRGPSADSVGEDDR
jgi:pilus assembly protein CpaB